MSLILVINPGGGSTKIAVFDGEECIMSRKINHPPEVLNTFSDTFSQREYREKCIMEALKEEQVDLESLDAVVGRGGALKPLESGTYEVNQLLVEDVRKGNVQTDHASNLGALMAFEMANPLGKPSYMVDPVSVDEFIDEARISGHPRMERKSLDHPLNAKMVARKAASELGMKYDRMNVIVAHLGTGISISVHERGRIIDVNCAHDGGPFSTQRTGTLPVTQLMDWCYSGELTRDEMFAQLTSKGGLFAYAGTDDAAALVETAKGGDRKAGLLLRAMAYQIAKEIGGGAAALKGRVDAMIYTGGVAHSEYIVGLIREYVDFITPNVFLYPGEHEMQSMAQGALRVLRGEEEPKQYV
jgi:butyrate kinase